ncbi:ABC transporter permease, partial [Vibrio cyclitrophicus 1F97]
MIIFRFSSLHLQVDSVYTEFTLNANFAMAAALSLILGLVTWFCLALAKRYGNASAAMGG